MSKARKAFTAAAVCLMASGLFFSAQAQSPAPKNQKEEQYEKQQKRLPQTPIPKKGKPKDKRPANSGFAQSKPSRAKILSNLYARLATARTKQSADKIAAQIEDIWFASGSATVSVLLQRAAVAFSEKRPGLALKFLDVVVELAPDFSEGWNRRAIAHYMRNDYARALGDLRRTLALDPNHYKALEGLAQILREVGQKKGALKAYRQLQRVHPFWPQTDDNIKQLERDVEGQGI